MLIGHFGIAQLGKATRRELPFALLLAAAYLPDIARVPLSAMTTRFDLWSHSIPIVLAMSAVLGLVWLVSGGKPSAACVLALACAFHWPADFFTGCKPTTFDGPWLGLMSYRRPVSDLLVEGALVAAGWLLARRRGMVIKGRWLSVLGILQVGFLISMYWGAEFFVGDREWTWKPDVSWIPRPSPLETTNCRSPDESAPAK